MDQSIDTRIVLLSDDQRSGYAMAAEGGSVESPGSEVAREHEGATPVLQGLAERLKAFELDSAAAVTRLSDVLTVANELDGRAAEVARRADGNRAPALLGFGR